MKLNGKMHALPGSGPLTVVQPVGGDAVVGGPVGEAVVPPVLHGGLDSSPNWLMSPIYVRCDLLQSIELVPAVTPSI